MKKINRVAIAGAVAAAVALVAVPFAAAHVRLDPAVAKAGSYTKFVIRVPNERDKASTVKVAVRIPAGISFVSFQPKAGWTRTVTMAKLSTPVKTNGGAITTRIDTVTWTARAGSAIAPGEFDEFGVIIAVPASAGKSLVFPATQTYSNGEVVRWIGPESADAPAPTVTVTK